MKKITYLFLLLSLVTFGQGPWLFNTDGNVEGWGKTGGAATSGAFGGYYQFDPTNANPTLTNTSITVDGTTHKFVKIVLRNTSDYPNLRIRFATIADNTLPASPSNSDLITVSQTMTTADATFKTYYFDLTSYPEWGDIADGDSGIEQYFAIRFGGGTTSVVDDFIYIDEISFLTALPTPTTTWDGSSWDNGAPTSLTYDAIFDGPYDGSELLDLTANNVTINNNVVLKKTFQVYGDLTVNSGKILDLQRDETNGFTPGTIVQRGNLIVNGTVVGHETGSVIRINGSGTTQEISGSGTVSVAQLTLIANKSLSTLIPVDVVSALKLNAGNTTLITNDNLTLKSLPNKTALADAPTGTTITGDVTVERYIPSAANRGWRAIAMPVKNGTAPNTVFANWQNNGMVSSTHGVEIWGPTGSNTDPANTSTGLAFGTSNSLLQYTGTTTGALWQGVIDTKSATISDSNLPKPYLLFVSGPFANGTGNITTGEAATTLVAKGALVQGDQTYNSIVDTKHTLIGNPFASQVNIEAAIDNATDLVPAYWVWDPNLATTGAYVTYDTSVGAYNNTTGSYADSALNGIIQSGQAFFVKAQSGSTGNFTILESYKDTNASSASNTNNVFRSSTTSTNLFGSLRVGLYKNSQGVWNGYDGTLVSFNSLSSNTIDNNDILKFNNASENIAFNTNEVAIASEHRNLPVANDVLPLKVWNTSISNYKLSISTQDFVNSNNLTAYLVDSFTNTSTQFPLDGSIFEYVFNVTSDANSTGERFVIQFGTVLSNDNFALNELVVYPNPANDIIQISGSTSTQFNYSIFNVLGQKVLNGNFNQTNSIALNALTNGVYIIEIRDENNQSQTVKFIKK